MFESTMRQQQSINNALKTKLSRDVRESCIEQNARIECILSLRDNDALNDNARAYIVNMIDDFRDGMRDDFAFDITKY